MMGHYYIPVFDPTLPHGLYDGGNFWPPLVRLSFPLLNAFKYDYILKKKKKRKNILVIFHILIQIKILHEASQARV